MKQVTSIFSLSLLMSKCETENVFVVLLFVLFCLLSHGVIVILVAQ